MAFPEQQPSIFLAITEEFLVKMTESCLCGAVQRGFCAQCGSHLFGKMETLPGLIAIRAGTLDDTDQYQPHVDLYVGSAAR